MTLAASVNQGRLLPKGVAYNRMFFMGVTGLTLTVTISKNGAAFGALAGTVAEVSVGWYKAALTSGDTGTEGDLAFHATDGGVNIEDWCDQVAAPVKLADGVGHGGTTATLRLGTSGDDPAFWVTNTMGDAGRFECITNASYGHGLKLVAGRASFSIGAGLCCYGGPLLGTGAAFTGGNDQGNGIFIESGSAPSLFAYSNNDAPAMQLECGANGPGLLVKGGYTSGPSISLVTTSGDAVSVAPTAGHGISITANGASKHDVALAGSGDIQGTLTGTVVANVKKVNDVTVTGTGASGNAWGP